MRNTSRLAGLIHTPLTPFDADGKLDLVTLERAVDFHVANGADAICAPTHAGELPSLREEERRTLIRTVIDTVDGRVPVIAHISGTGTMLTARSAADAEQAGAAAILATVPYYWKPPAAMQLEHFAAIGSAVDLPLLIHNSPDEMGGVALSTEFLVKVAEQVDNFAGLVDSSLNWEFLVEVVPRIRAVRPDFLILSGVEHMVSMYAIGGSGAFSALSSIAPRLIRTLRDHCAREDYAAARQAQFDASKLLSMLKPWYASSIKAVLSQMGRDMGHSRPPVMPLEPEARTNLWRALEATNILAGEPRGW